MEKRCFAAVNFPDFAKTKTSSNSWDSEKETEERQLFANEKNPKD